MEWYYVFWAKCLQWPKVYIMSPKTKTLSECIWPLPPPQYGEIMPNRMPASGVATALEVVQLREESCVRSKHNYHIFTHFVDAWPITFDCYLRLIVFSSFLNLFTPFRVVMNEFVTPLLNVEATLQNQKVHYIVQPYWQLVIISKLSVNTDSTCTLTLETV